MVDVRFGGLDDLDRLAVAVDPLLRPLFPDPEPVRLAVHEAVVNGLVHGEAPVTASLRVLGADLVVEVTDGGPGFDPAAVPDPTAPAGLLRTSGRGLLLIRRVAHTVHVRGAAGGTTVEFCIRTPRGEP